MNQFQEIFDKQKAYFDSDATKSYEWRIDQLTRLENLCNENAEALEAAMSSDFKTASQEKVFEIMAPVGTAAFAKQELKEWMKPVDVVVPKALRESGHTAKVYREPYGVTLGDRSVQWAIDAALRPCVPGYCGWQSMHSQTLRGFARHQQGLAGSHSEIFRSSGRHCRHRQQRRGDGASQAALRLHLLHRQRQGWQDRHGGGRKESDSRSSRTRRPESSLR
jgi:hypothetical protein